MAYVVPAVLGGLALCVIALFSATSARRARKKARNPSVEPQARILIHSINDDRCTGCDACVAVCPTNVLDLVGNKSRVLHFQDCIQCEACMWACPTTALVMHPEGSDPPPVKVPNLDEFYQTAVPGQYLIGEVAGKPLVKNAANLGRSVVEHMVADGLMPTAPHFADGSDAKTVSSVDVAIVGSGPGGLSAALTCVNKGLSYVVLEKENIVASTIARYPKGKLLMAEPYDSPNLSFLPVFDSSKEEIVPLWTELIQRTNLNVELNATVETVTKRKDGLFDLETGRGQYRAQRIVLATGLRGKPRTLGIRGEELAKVHSLLEDPNEFRGQAVCVVGGGDSALEAAVALADAGAKVVLTYRGRAFSRSAPKNKQMIESYEAQRRIKIKYASDVVELAEATVTIRTSDGQYKRYPNEATFVLIGADPPVKWLSQLGISYIERPHMVAMPPPHELVRRLAPQSAYDCPEDAPRAAALAMGKDVAQVLAERPVKAMSKPRKWLRSATNIFTGAGKLDKPMPLSEFAKRSRKHSGRGRRDELPPGERTRILRMLRDEGGRLADEDSKVFVIDDVGQDVELRQAGRPDPRAMAQMPVHDEVMKPPPAHAQAPPMTLEMSRMEEDQLAQLPQFGDNQTAPKQAVIVGLARAAADQRRKRRSGAPPAQSPPEFIDSPTQHVPDEQAREQARRSSPPPPVPAPAFPIEQHDEATNLASFDGVQFMQQMQDDEATRQIEVPAELPTEQEQPMLGAQSRRPPLPPPSRLPLPAPLPTEPAPVVGGSVKLHEPPEHLRTVDSVYASDQQGINLRQLAANSDDPTKQIDLDGLASLERADSRADTDEKLHDDPTKQIDLDKDRIRTLSDVDFDLD